VFEISHRVIGIGTLILAWINVSSGAELYSERYHHTPDYSLVSWIVVAVGVVITLGLGLAGRCKIKTSSSS
jgi:hypothetical protein